MLCHRLKLTILAGMLFVPPLATVNAVFSADDSPGQSRRAELSEVVSFQTPESGQPVAAAADATGRVHLVFQGESGPRYTVSTDCGKSFAPSIAVARRGDAPAGLEFDAWSLAIGKGGSVHVALGSNAWKLKLPQEEWAFFYARLDAGGKDFAPLVNLNRRPSEGFSLAADGAGRVTACWLADKLYANVSQDDGRSFDETVELDSAYDPCNCCTTSATYGADGKLALLYREETDNQRDMHLVLWDQAKNVHARTRVSGIPWQVDACPMTYYSIVPNGSGYLGVWPTRGSIYLARIDGEGKVGWPGEVKTRGKQGMRTGLTVLASAAGDLLVVWNQSQRVYWQRYDRGLQAVGELEFAPTTGASVAAVVDASGRFVIFK